MTGENCYLQCRVIINNFGMDSVARRIYKGDAQKGLDLHFKDWFRIWNQTTDAVTGQNCHLQCWNITNNFGYLYYVYNVLQWITEL